MKRLAEMVKSARIGKGLRGFDLAHAIGRDPSYVSRLENGTLKEIPAPDVVTGLASALGIPVVTILRAIGYDIPEGQPPTYPDDRLRFLAANWHLLTSERRDYLVWMVRKIRQDHGLEEEPEPVVAVNRAVP